MPTPLNWSRLRLPDKRAYHQERTGDASWKTATETRYDTDYTALHDSKGAPPSGDDSGADYLSKLASKRAMRRRWMVGLQCQEERRRC